MRGQMHDMSVETGCDVALNVKAIPRFVVSWPQTFEDHIDLVFYCL
jgi:hypothetical protein